MLKDDGSNLRSLVENPPERIRPLYKHLVDINTKTYLNHIWNMAHRYRFGWTQAITGGVRCGKSMTICTLAELLNQHPLDEYNFGFTPKEYLRSLDNAKKGEVLVWSELGTALNARKWQSVSNILTGEVLQTMMIKRPIVFMDVPDLSFVDVQARKLIYAYAEARRWESSPVKLYVYRVSVDRREGKTYFPHPLVKTNGRVRKLSYIQVNTMTPSEIWRIYDKKQQDYKDKLRKKNLVTIERAEKELVGESKTIYDYVNVVTRDVEVYKKPNGRLNLALMRAKLHISKQRSEEIAAIIESEGSGSAPTGASD